MKFTKEIEKTIKTFIIEQVSSHKNDIVTFTMKHFGISKPTTAKFLNQLVSEGIIEMKRKGRYPDYSLVTKKYFFTYKLKDKLEEDIILRKDILPLLSGLQENVQRIVQYCFTEMVNNVIDHSNADTMNVEVDLNALNIEIWVIDNGVGIFNKIQKDLGLEDPKHSILELAKGKFTSDPERHSGEGIFFTSRLCNKFMILSGRLFFSGHHENDWLLENPDSVPVSGTVVSMLIEKKSNLNISDIFNEYADPDKQPGFYKTRIPVKLMQYEGALLLSRSQAKRLITRFDKFLEVILDFQGVSEIGQAFADEVFRVFRNAHPDVHLKPINCVPAVQRMSAYISADYFQNVYNSDSADINRLN